MKDIVILGVGGFARELVTLIKDINKSSITYNFLGYIDNGTPKGTMVNGYPIIGNDDDLLLWDKPISVVLAFGAPSLKEKVKDVISRNPLISFPTLIHPSVIIGDKEYVRIGIGCIICAGCIITTNVDIDDFVTLNLQCTVGHDTKIKQYTSVMPSCNISGEVIVGEKVYLGTGAKIINQLSIGCCSIIGAGAVVVNSIPEYCTAVGVPAKPLNLNVSDD